MSQGGTPPNQGAKSGNGTRLLWGALVVSLIFNFFIVGVVIGNRVAERRADDRVAERHARPPALSTSDPRGLIRMLPPQSRRQIGRAIRGDVADVRPLLRQSHRKRKAAIEALAAEPYDEEALAAAFAASREADQALSVAIHEMMLKIADNLSAEDREIIRDALKQRQERRHGRFLKRRPWLDDRRGPRDEPPPPGSE